MQWRLIMTASYFTLFLGSFCFFPKFFVEKPSLYSAYDHFHGFTTKSIYEYPIIVGHWAARTTNDKYEYASQNETKLQVSLNSFDADMKSFLEPSYALCDMSRPRGCQPLLSRSNAGFRISPFAELPCVVNGTCPYKSFRCRKGHKWKAVPGSPVCFYCPKCTRASSVLGESRTKLNTRPRNLQISHSTDVHDAVQTYVHSRGGACLSNHSLKWSSRVDLKCKFGHVWTTRAAALVKENSWCPYCFQKFKQLHNDKLHETASHFGGYYLGPAFQNHPSENYSTIPVSRQLHKWRCFYGHTFIQRPNNIRRSPKSKRPCSWCPVCRSSGINFEWLPKQRYIVQKVSFHV